MAEEILNQPGRTTFPSQPNSHVLKYALFAVAGLLLLAGVAGGYWYWWGTKISTFKTQMSKPQPKTQIPETPAPEPTADWETYINQEIENQEIEKRESSFSSYKLEYPSNWVVKKPSDEGFVAELSNSDYKITINQGAMGEEVCIFPGEPDFEGPSVKYSDYKEIKTDKGILFRRGQSEYIRSFEKEVIFSVCQAETSSGRYVKPTKFGGIGYHLPKVYDQKILDQMDVIISTIESVE